MLNGLDLFSGGGGLALALDPWVTAVAFCEIDRFAQSVLLSLQYRGRLPIAPIWDDVRTLSGSEVPAPVDIISGGFPCQNISLAGDGLGLEGESSSLFWEIDRITGELEPSRIFLENVPAITTRGGLQVAGALTARGYDSRWLVIQSGHSLDGFKGERWFCLAQAQSKRWENLQLQPAQPGSTSGLRNEGLDDFTLEVAPALCGAPDGLPYRAHRIRILGNAVVPLQARTAFEILSGIKQKGTHTS